MSTQIKVELLHPDWDADQVSAEVERIHSERNLGKVADPAAIGAGGFDLAPPQPQDTGGGQ
jgi:hypothetical protein